MKVLLMNQFFWPDSAATSQLLTDVAAGMAAQGHEVHVICSESCYAAASSKDRFAGGGPPVAIHRVKASRFTRGLAGRVLSYLSFYLGALWLCLTLPRPELVVTLTTPPLLCLLGTLVQRLRGARHFIWEMDVYPDVAIALDYFKAGGLMDRSVGFLADASRRGADGILALGECMRDLLIARGIDGAKIAVAENWADGSAIVPVERAGPRDKLVLLYSGNLGLAHDVETIAGSMFTLRDSDAFQFIFTGGGPRRQELETFCRGESLDAVEFRSYVQRAGLGESLGAGDIGLVTQRDSCCGSVVPSKIYGMLAAGRPILFIGPPAATPARIIRRHHCGWQIACGDVAALTALLERLAADRAAVEAAGRRARQALLDHYDLPIGVARICELLGLGLPAAPSYPYPQAQPNQEQVAYREEALTGTNS